MTDLTYSVLRAFVNAVGARSAREIAADLQLANASTIVASIVSLCDEAMLIRVASVRPMKYEATQKGRERLLKLQPGLAGAP